MTVQTNILNKKYPIETRPKQTVVLIILVGLFVGGFIYFFRPFGLEVVDGGAIFLWGYGLVSMLVLILNLFLIKFVLPNVFKEEKWTVLKNIIWLLWIISTIGLGNYFYSIFLFQSLEFNLNGVFLFQFYTIVIGLVPIIVITLVTQNKYLKKNIKDASAISGNLTKKETPAIEQKLIKLSSENEKEELEILVNDLLFIESAGNYVEINYLHEEEFKIMLLRSSLKRISETTSDYSELFKSHRSFIINTKNIIDVKGNAQGYQISMKNSEKIAPVSRSYINKFKEIFK